LPLTKNMHGGIFSLVTALAIVVMWRTMWLPAHAYLEEAKKQYAYNVTEQAWLARHASEQTGQPSLEQKSLSAILTETSQSSHIVINSLTIESENRVQFHSVQMPYTVAVNWLYLLETKFNLKLDELEINKTEEGMVDIKATIVKPATP
jgi:type II secretory pathway component PulM